MASYRRIATSREPLSAVGAPVEILAFALLRDEESGLYVAQIKLRNTSERTLSSAMIEVRAYDAGGSDVVTVFHTYSGLAASKGADFGQSEAVPLSEQPIARYGIRVVQVTFLDGSTWRAVASLDWKPTSKDKPSRHQNSLRGFIDKIDEKVGKRNARIICAVAIACIAALICVAFALSSRGIDGSGVTDIELDKTGFLSSATATFTNVTQDKDTFVILMRFVDESGDYAGMGLAVAQNIEPGESEDIFTPVLDTGSSFDFDDPLDEDNLPTFVGVLRSFGALGGTVNDYTILTLDYVESVDGLHADKVVSLPMSEVNSAFEEATNHLRSGY